MSQRKLLTPYKAHSLSASEAGRSLPIEVRGVVTYFDPNIDPRHAALFIQDRTGGVFVAIPHTLGLPAEALKPGMFVEVKGQSSPGDFASTVSAAEIRVLANHVPIPQPKNASLADLRMGLEDCARVEVNGVVQSIVYSANNVTLELALRDGTIGATTPRSPKVDYEGLVDATIRLDAVAAPLFNHDRQITGARLYFQDASQVHVQTSGQRDPFQAPLRSISELSRYSNNAGTVHRAHVRGTVSLIWPNRMICVQDASRGVCAELDQNTGLHVGDAADVAGFVQFGGYRPTLAHAKFRPSENPHSLSAPLIAERVALRGDYDSELVQMEGQVIGQDAGSTQSTLLLSAGKAVFAVRLPPSSSPSSLEAIPNGSVVRVTGICSVQLDEVETLRGGGFEVAKSFTLLTRSASDIIILHKATMWTARRILLLLVLVLALTALVLAWVYVLRRRVEHQTRVIRESEERFRYLAQHDALTNLPNRSLLRERLDSALESALLKPTQLALLMVDLDDFKSINDTLGHHAGDEALRVTARRLIQAVRTGDTVARMGGDEFMILLHGLDYENQPEQIAERIVDAFTQEADVGLMDVSLSVSVGVYTITDLTSSDVDVLLKKVDAAMYAAKSSGRNCFRSFSSEMAVACDRVVQIRAHLTRALAKHEFELHYQPLANLKTEQIGGFEALLRWNSSELGSVPPDEFIPIAEESDLIVQIGEWVIAEAVRQVASLQEKYQRDFFVAINLSSRQFIHENLAEVIQATLEKHLFRPANLKLEITERTLMSYAPDVQRVLRAIRILGVQLAIDDFGVGFSSLSYISQLPVDWIKVDRSLISDCTRNPRSAAVLRAIVAMAKSIGLSVVAEGIETAEQFALVQQENCDLGQGYWISRPVQIHLLVSLLGQKLTRNEPPLAASDLPLSMHRAEG